MQLAVPHVFAAPGKWHVRMSAPLHTALHEASLPVAHVPRLAALCGAPEVGVQVPTLPALSHAWHLPVHA